MTREQVEAEQKEEECRTKCKRSMFNPKSLFYGRDDQECMQSCLTPPVAATGGGRDDDTPDAESEEASGHSDPVVEPEASLGHMTMSYTDDDEPGAFS